MYRPGPNECVTVWECECVRVRVCECVSVWVSGESLRRLSESRRRDSTLCIVKGDSTRHNRKDIFISWQRHCASASVPVPFRLHITPQAEVLWPLTSSPYSMCLSVSPSVAHACITWDSLWYSFDSPVSPGISLWTGFRPSILANSVAFKLPGSRRCDHRRLC